MASVRHVGFVVNLTFYKNKDILCYHYQNLESWVGV